MLKLWSGRPAHTLLFITEVKTFRVDTDRRGILLGDVESIEVGCKSPTGLAKAFEKIAAAGEPLGKKVWLLFLRLPALLINVPTLQVKGVDRATLTQALQFEAEGMTGVSSQDMKVAFRFLQSENDMSDYWLVQIEQLAWEDLVKTVKRQRCKLGGVLHPGLMPRALFDAQASEWLRLEAWSNRVLAILQHEGRISLQDYPLDNPHWPVELEHWIQEQGGVALTETLLNNKVELLPSTGPQMHLNENSQLAEWLGLWAQILLRGNAENLALLEVGSTINLDVAWMVGSGLSALLLCGLHAGWFVYQRAYYEAETVRLTQVEQTMTALRKQINEKSEQHLKLENRLNKATANADLIPATIQALRQRPALLLRALAEGRDEQLIVETLDSQGSELTVSGVALQMHLSNQLASYLTTRLPTSYWKIQLPLKEDMALFEGEPGPWKFSVKLMDEGIPELAP